MSAATAIGDARRRGARTVEVVGGSSGSGALSPLTGHGCRTLSSLHVAHAHSWAWLASRFGTPLVEDCSRGQRVNRRGRSRAWSEWPDSNDETQQHCVGNGMHPTRASLSRAVRIRSWLHGLPPVCSAHYPAHAGCECWNRGHLA
jgi:hypothetical protein